MINIKLAVAGILLPLATIAQEKTDFKLSISIKAANEKTRVYLAWQTEGKKILDSTVKKDGLFVFNGKVDRPLNATLITDYEGLGSQQLIKRGNTGGVNDALKFYIHPGEIALKTDRLIGNAVFSGSVINSDNERLKAILKPISDEETRISKLLRAGNYVGKESVNRRLSPQDSLMVRKWVKALDSLAAARQPHIKAFIAANPNSYIALKSLMSIAGSFPNLAIIQPMFDKLSPAIRSSLEGKAFNQFLFDRENMVAGTIAPDFTQNDTSGRPISLSSFKGKYVLLDFWASWCGPCRANNPALVKVFEDYKDKNFTILGISLDEVDGKKEWLKAIKDDRLNWTQVSDLKHWDNSVAKLYGIHAIPQSYLIDPKGIIIAKGLNSLDLRKKLEEILAK
jgi:peroxiredoxin